MAQETEVGHGWQRMPRKEDRSRGKRHGREKTRGPGRKWKRKLRGIREQQEARDTIVAQLKKAEVRKMAEDRCRSAEWETRGGPDTGRTRDGRWGFARNQSGGKDGLSAAKSDWVSRSQSAQYLVVCGRVRLVDTNRSCGTGKAERKRIGVCGRSTEAKGPERKAKESAGEGRKVAEDVNKKSG